MTDQSRDNQLPVLAIDATHSVQGSDANAHGDAALHAHFFLYKTLGEIAGAVKSLEFSCDLAQRRLSLLENVARHDVTIDDATWEAVADFRYDGVGIAFSRIKRNLTLCLDNIQQAACSVRGVFRAELKVKIEDRIQRHLRETAALMNELDRLSTEHLVPRQPYLIRQATLSGVLLDFAGMVEMSREFRNTLDPGGIRGQVRAALTEQEAMVLRVRRPLAKWRDNPSQKMEDKLQTARRQLLGVANELEKLQAAALYECKLAGVVICNRCGPWNYLPDVQPRTATHAAGEVQPTTA